MIEASDIFCEQCGSTVSSESKFCGQCGNRIGQERHRRRAHFTNVSTPKAIPLRSPAVVIGAAAILVFCALLVVLFKNTVTNYPTEAVAKKVFENQYRDQINGGFAEIVSFKRTNGQASEMYGVKLYTIEYEADIKYPKGVNSNCSRTEFTGWDCWFAAIGGGQIRQKGEIEKRRGKLIFERTEKGWKGPDGQLISNEYEKSQRSESGAALKEKVTNEGRLQPEYSAQSIDAEMKSDLKNAVDAQEAFFANGPNRYTSRVEELTGYNPTPGVVLAVEYADTRRFVLVAKKAGGSVPAWTFDSRTGQITPRSGPGSASNVSASPTPNISSGNLRSVENRIRAEVIFENRLKERVLVWWVNYQGQEVLYRELDPQQIYSVSSFVTHPWRVRIKRNGQKVREIVANAPKVFVAVEN